MRKKSVKREKAIDFFEVPETENAGVYAIINFEDFCCYVGSTGNIKKRATDHKRLLINGKHTNKYLQDAANDNKILRFVLLKEFEEQPKKDVLLLLEYCYMLKMEVKCFELYNIQPQGHYGRKNKYDALVETIANSVLIMTKASENIENAIYKTYGTNTGYMINTQYREYWAKKEIGLDTKPTTARTKIIDNATSEKEDIFTLFNAKKAEYEANKQRENQDKTMESIIKHDILAEAEKIDQELIAAGLPEIPEGTKAEIKAKLDATIAETEAKKAEKRKAEPMKDAFLNKLEQLKKDNNDGKLALNIREETF